MMTSSTMILEFVWVVACHPLTIDSILVCMPIPHSQECVDAGLVPHLVRSAYSNKSEGCEALWAISNAVTGASSDVLNTLSTLGVAPALCKGLMGAKPSVGHCQWLRTLCWLQAARPDRTSCASLLLGGASIRRPPPPPMMLLDATPVTQCGHRAPTFPLAGQRCLHGGPGRSALHSHG